MYVFRGDHQNGAVRAHGQRRAQRFLRLFHADGNSNDFVGLTGFFQANGLFDGNLVKRVHRHFYVRPPDPSALTRTFTL